MDRIPIGTIVLIVVSLLIFFGFAQRILDRMRLSDRAAIAIIALMIAGSFITIPVTRGLIGVDVNVGGALIPLALSIYVLSKAGSAKEWVRAIGAAIGAAIAVAFSTRILGGAEPETMFMDPLYFYPLAAGLIAYIISRSRRSAFIAGILGMMLYDAGLLAWYYINGLRGFVSFGGGGVFDAYVIAGIAAALLAEIIGETRERLQGGPESRGKSEELLAGLKNPEFANSLAPWKRKNTESKGRNKGVMKDEE